MQLPKIWFDVECYPNYFLIKFMNEANQFLKFELSCRSKLDVRKLYLLLSRNDVEFVSFNGIAYDVPIITLAMSGASTEELYAATEEIIKNDMRHWQFYKAYRLIEPQINHVDLIEVAPGRVSLKIYGGRLHCADLEDLPYPPGTILTPEQMDHVDLYCGKDLRNTRTLTEELAPQIDLRRLLGEQYGVDLRSKSDAQIAEAVLKAEVLHLAGVVVKKTTLNYGKFHYEPPEYVRFQTPELQEVLRIVTSAEYVIKPTGHVEMPNTIEKLTIVVGDTRYKIGIGGLHSQEESVAYHTNADAVVAEWDVTSYYPNLMLNMGLNPPSFHGYFPQIYRSVLDRRVAAKARGDNISSELLKITLNGTFGKTSSKYSILYDPRQMIRTTLSGQLSLLMLIEWLTIRGLQVVSANTDGLVVLCPRNRTDEMNAIVAHWEKATGLNMEGGQFDHLYARDVNNYVAITPKGKVKRKGIFAAPGIRKSPNNEICVDAVIDYLTKGTPIAETIRGCQDIRKFITLRTVDGGAHKPGYTLGKVVRWYYSTEDTGCITYAENGNRVPCSARAKPVMVLPKELPTDIDYARYIRIAKKMLVNIAAIPAPALPKRPRKNTKAWKAFVETGLIVLDEDAEKDDVWVWAEELAFYAE